MHLPEKSYLQNGKYRIIRFISSGGFGCTYEAEHVQLGKKVAIKEFFVKDFCNRDEHTHHVTVGTKGKEQLVEKLKKKFVSEAKMIVKLHHPGIVSVSDIFEENGTAYYVMDYIDGRSISDIVNKHGPLDEPLALKYIYEVCDALAYVHERNLLHLDIKPANIMVDKADHAILIDFGASKQYDEVGGENTSTLVGRTPGYAPLEQMDNDIKRFYPATDIYALGATLYKMLTGKTPLSATALAAGEMLPPLPDNVSTSTRKAIASAMELNKKMRPQSVDDFLQLLNGQSDEIIVDDTQTISENKNATLNAGQLNDLGIDAFEHRRIDDASSYFFKAANMGLSDAMYNLGLVYERKKNYDQAFNWYNIAAQKGHPTAMLSLADCYENGKHVNIDLKTALFWYRKAAEKGNKEALRNIERLKRSNRVKGKTEYTQLLYACLWFIVSAALVALLVWFFDGGGGRIKVGAFILPIVTAVNGFKCLIVFFKSLFYKPIE